MPYDARNRALSARDDALTLALRALSAARASGDAAAERHAAHALYRALRRLDRLFAGFGFRGADADDLRQQTLLGVLEHLDEVPQVGNLRAWVNTIARHLALDLLRKRRRQKTRPVEPASLADLAGGHAPFEPFEKAAEERVLADYRARIAGWIEAYVDRASKLRVPRGHHVRAWYLRHIEGRPIAAIRGLLTVEGRTPSVDGTCKWIERGRALVRELAFDDTDHERGEAFLRAVDR